MPLRMPAASRWHWHSVCRPRASTRRNSATEAAVTLDPDGQGFKISKSALTLRGKVPNLDDAGFARIAGEAEKNCPVSKVLNAAITLDAKARVAGVRKETGHGPQSSTGSGHVQSNPA